MSVFDENHEYFQTKLSKTEYPVWALFIAFGMVFMAIAPVPMVWFLRKFKIWKVEADIPAVSYFFDLPL